MGLRPHPQAVRYPCSAAAACTGPRSSVMASLARHTGAALRHVGSPRRARHRRTVASSGSSGPAALRRVVLPASPLPQPGIRGGRRPRPARWIRCEEACAARGPPARSCLLPCGLCTLELDRAARRRASRRDALSAGRQRVSRAMGRSATHVSSYDEPVRQPAPAATATRGRWQRPEFFDERPRSRATLVGAVKARID